MLQLLLYLKNSCNSTVKSDHYIISCDLHFTSTQCIPTSEPIYNFIYSKGDYEGLNNFLCSADFSTCFPTNDVEFIWFFIKYALNDAMSNFIPKIKLNSAHQPKYFD